jgi:hypothetical protein
MARFVRVSSQFYPDLHRYYEAEAATWLENRLAGYGMEDGDDEFGDDESDA